MSNSDMVLGILAGLAICFVAIVAAVGPVHDWEKRKNYPFGQMCNSVFTGFQNTCP